MRARVMKYEKGLAVRIPASLAKQAGLKAGMVVDITVSGTKITVTTSAHDEVTLEQLLSKITPENLHGEVWVE